MNIQKNNTKPATSSIMYDVLPLINSTLLTADMILSCTKTLYPIHGSHSSFRRKMYIPLLTFLCNVRRLLVRASVVPSSPILVTLMKEALSPPKRRFLQKPHRITSQETPFFAMNVTVNLNSIQTFSCVVQTHKTFNLSQSQLNNVIFFTSFSILRVIILTLWRYIKRHWDRFSRSTSVSLGDSFHRLHHTLRLSSGAGTRGQIMTDLPSALSLIPFQDTGKQLFIAWRRGKENRRYLLRFAASLAPCCLCPEDGGDILLRNFGLSPNSSALQRSG
jgi:hypothetical protein